MVVELIVVEESEVNDVIKVLESGLKNIRINPVVASKLLRWCDMQRYIYTNNKEIDKGLGKEK